MTDIITKMAQVVPELSTSFVTGVFQRQSGASLALTDLESVTLTLMDEATQTILNERDEDDILNDNGCTIEADGSFELELSPEDNVIINDRVSLEAHMAIISYDYTGPNGTITAVSVARFEVRNLVHRP